MCATVTPLQTFVSPASSPVGVPASDGAQQASKEDTEYILMLSAQAEDMRQRWVVPEPRVPRVRVREGRWGEGDNEDSVCEVRLTVSGVRCAGSRRCGSSCSKSVTHSPQSSAKCRSS